MSVPEFSIRLAKEDFKFSAAHFTLFPDGCAELLHGHNYRVRLELTGRCLGEVGLLFDVSLIKRAIRERCAALDERTLIPTGTDRLTVTRRDATVEVRFRDRFYSFPMSDVVLLPLANISIELLAQRLWHELARTLADARIDTVDRLTVEVEETPGQSCAYSAAVDRIQDIPRQV